MERSAKRTVRAAKTGRVLLFNTLEENGYLTFNLVQY
jgi:hypothetical protein